MMNQGDRYGDTEDICILLYSFLESSSDIAFASKLSTLKNQLLVQTPFRTAFDEGELQTDGNSFGRVEERALVADEEVFRRIGAQLAVIGDRLAAEIEPSFVNNLAQQFMVQNVPSQEITQHLSQAVEAVMRTMPRDMEQEKAMLVAAMVLAKKVANIVPAFLQQVFNTTVNYINHNLHDYVNNLAPEN
ncbi:BH3-interacting domain death agonist isoform X2 [Candoia aspera]|uniref:BH3-interacting domain death agonist isoform X2 n=1 Tax=Candoia aspera TaxID=51853 RepID=UPI002FD80969